MQSTQPQLIDSGPEMEATGLIHRVQFPSGPGPYPTVVMLHGRYGNEDVMWIFKRTLPVSWLQIAPRATEPDHGGYSWIIQPDGTWPALPAFDPAVDKIVHFIEALPQLYNADPESIYLMGFSQGAAVAYATALRRPQLVQAIAGLVGFVPEDCNRSPGFSALRGMPIFMAVGREDQRVPFERAQMCRQTLQEAGADLTYHAYDTGHKVNSQGMKALTNWWMERAQTQHRQKRI